MELRLQYVSIMMNCELSFTGTEKIFALNLFNVAIAITGRLGLRCFLLFLEKCKYFQPQNVPLDISEKNEAKVKQNLDKKSRETGEGLLRTRISSTKLLSSGTLSVSMHVFGSFCRDQHRSCLPASFFVHIIFLLFCRVFLSRISFTIGIFG